VFMKIDLIPEEQIMYIIYIMNNVIVLFGIKWIILKTLQIGLCLCAPLVEGIRTVTEVQGIKGMFHQHSFQ